MFKRALTRQDGKRPGQTAFNVCEYRFSDLVPTASGLSGRRLPAASQGSYRRKEGVFVDRQPCVYILKCRDGSLYTGWTNHIEKRLSAHNSGSGAKYTRGRRPVALVYLERQPDRASALKREAAIKKMKRPQKEALIKAFSSEFSAGSGSRGPD